VTTRLIDEPTTVEGWRTEALCAQTDPEIFFPEKGTPARAALRVCAACPVELRVLPMPWRVGT